LPLNNILGWESIGAKPRLRLSVLVLRIGGDLGINKALTWNVVSFRYRVSRAMEKCPLGAMRNRPLLG